MATERRDAEFEALTERQGAFCRNLIRGMSQAQAAREAGYAARSARRQASRLMTNVHVQTALRALRERANAEAMADHGELVRQATLIERAYLGQVIRPDGSVDIEACIRAKQALKKYKVTERVLRTAEGEEEILERSTEVEMHDPLKANARVAKLLGLDAAERHKHEHEGNVGQIIRYVYEEPDGTVRETAGQGGPDAARAGG